ncbi:hypothetical protein [Herbaspirillum sp. alder98]|uniref:hypothetical protein n=1 Tax=Herbaspirillum sp. alder98 TaxID=2913096 RepID=UPI001CD8F5A7|nr:hypothetical protein [Herbaspirillum sp. alder98]MCA1323589.1 hypothetical protein [Herbaspirillum sp. alder98]
MNSAGGMRCHQIVEGEFVRRLSKCMSLHCFLPLIKGAFFISIQVGVLAQSSAAELKVPRKVEKVMNQQESVLSAEQLEQNLKASPRPRNLIERLENLKLAWEHHWLLHRDFYSSQGLPSFLGMRIESVETSAEDGRTSFFISLNASGDGIPIHESSTSRSSRIFGWINGSFNIEDGKKRGWINLKDIASSFSFEDVEKVFGKHWTKVPVGSAPNWLPPAAASRDGNLDVTFDFNDFNEVHRRIVVQTNPDGTVRYFRIEIER